MRVRNVHQFVIVFEIEVMVRRHVGVEIGLGAIDADLTQQSRVGQLVERIVNGGKRDRNLGQRRLFVEHFRGEVARTFAEQEPAQSHALPGRAKPCRL